MKKLAESETERASEQARAAQRSKRQSLAAMALAAVALAAFVWAAKAQREAVANARKAEANAHQTEEARQKIEETLAGNLIERIHDFPGDFGHNESEALWQIAGLTPEHELLRREIMSLAFSNEGHATRLINRGRYVARALIGFDEKRRQLALDDTITPILKNPSATSDEQLAAARMGLALNVEGIEFAEFAVRTLSSEIIRYRDNELLDKLSADLNTAIRSIPFSESQLAVDPIINAIQQTRDPRILKKLCDAVGELPGQMTPPDVLRISDQLLHVMENEKRPDSIRELSESLVSLPKNLNVINAARGIKYIVQAIENTKRTEVRNSLVMTIRSWCGRLVPDDFKVTEDEILQAVKGAQDSETMSVFARCLAAVAVHHSQSDIQQATNVLLKAMQLVEESDPLYELSKGLGQLNGRISENAGHTAIARILKVMAIEDSSRGLRLLAESVCAVPVQMSDEENAAATRILLTYIENDATLPLDLYQLSNGLSTLPKPLSIIDGQQAFDSLFRALDRFERAYMIHKIQDSMLAVGGKLNAPTADVVAEGICKRMESCKDAEKVRALAYGLRGMERVVDSAKIKKAYEVVRDKINDKAFEAPIELSLLSETLSIIPENIPEDIAEDALERMLAVLVSTENSEIVQLIVEKIGFVGGDISKEVGHKAVQRILNKIKSTKESSLLRVLSLGLASVAIELDRKDKFTENDAAEVAHYLVMAMDVSDSPDVLISLGQAMEKVAPKLQTDGDQAVVRQVIDQNLRSIQGTQSPQVIGQLARIWQVMAPKMTGQETQEAFEQILASNRALANVAARPALCQAAVALAMASDKSQANYALEYLLSALDRDHEPEVLKIMLEGVEELASRVPESDVKRAKAAILAMTGDQVRTNEQILNRLFKSLGKLPGGFDLAESVELLKSPFCIGSAQQTLLNMIEVQTKLSFNGNPWKLVASAEKAGIDSKTFKQPVLRPQKLKLNLPRVEAR